MKKQILELPILENIRQNEKHFLLKLSTKPDLLPNVNSGQFAEVLVENSPEAYLRRPISINFFDKKKQELWLLIQEVGVGTKRLSTLQKGDKLNLVLPLGNGFTLQKNKRVLLIGGGVGVAPLLNLARDLKENACQVEVLIGAKTGADLLLIDKFKQFANVHISTEDGSVGEVGFVTQHSILKTQKFDFVYTCGPTPMMKAVANFARENAVPCEVSLENKMACGIGACLCCVTKTQTGHRCVCTEGPVFNINDLLW